VSSTATSITDCRPRAFPQAASAWLAALIGVFLAAGTIGHDPWKPDEAYTFGLVHHIVESGDLVVPTLAGEPFMEKPPLYYGVASLTARLFAPVLPMHDGARMASVLFMVLAATFTALAARELFGAGRGPLAALLLLGSLGVCVPAHTLITDVALLAGCAIAAFGLASIIESPRRGGAILGTGIGIGFMSKGLVEPGMFGIAALLLPAIFRRWRSGSYAQGLTWAALFALPWMLAWPVALYARSPELFREWFWVNNFGRYFGFAHLGADDEPWYFTRTLPWFTLPAGAVALYGFACHAASRGLDLDRGHQLVAAMCAGILLVLTTSASARELYALPLLVPLSIGASAAADRLPRWMAAAFAWTSAALAAAVAGLAWFIWIEAVAQGAPPEVAVVSSYLPSSFRFPFEAKLFAAAAAATLLWAGVWRSHWGGATWLVRWTANVAMAWSVVMTLLLPWIDEAKSFREAFVSLSSALPPSAACVASTGLGEGQRAMLEYFANRTTERTEVARRDCRFILLQASHDGIAPELPPGRWSLLWRGARKGEAFESFSLYERRTEMHATTKRQLPESKSRG